MSAPLKPCPFCGGRAMWADGEQKHRYGNEQVHCGRCYALAAPFPTKAEARECWNRRTPDRAALVEVARRASMATVNNLAKAKYPIEPLDTTAERVVTEYMAE